MGNVEFERFSKQFEAALNQDPTYRSMKPVDASWLLGYLQVDPTTGIAPGIDVVTPDGVRPMVWLTGWRYVVGLFGRVQAWGLDLDPNEWAILRPGHYTGPPIVDGYLVTSPAVFGEDVPAPPGRVDAPGTDGIGPRWMANTTKAGGSYSVTTATTSAMLTPADITFEKPTLNTRQVKARTEMKRDEGSRDCGRRRRRQ